MLKTKKIACIIPARLQSTRRSRKVLAKIFDKTILEWIWQTAHKISYFDHVIFAIDAAETAQCIKSFGGNYIMTSSTCPSGTDRVIEVMLSGKISADVWINWQGDEPFVTKTMIDALVQTCDHNSECIWTLKKKIEKKEEITSPNTVKVVCDTQGNALYFSRSPIPFYRDFKGEQLYYKHLGLYAFTTPALKKIALLEESFLEQAEKLEQLRYLQNGFSIKVHETNEDVIEINTQEDLEHAQNYAQKYLIHI
ncbi:MAG: 3-deoxy-manno-octulosonate cytidylyltransferase [bacterium]